MFSSESVAQAEQHINEIREDFDLNNLRTSRHVQNLDRALDVLSDQLYQKPTHFLLELIQNADDNDYQNDKPTLTFTYEDRKLRIDCNEKGFSRANVEAICRIGCSTKSGLDAATRYVGEKGIGFKSVFKVADKVWISSNGYTFKFDKCQPLGMIAPQWESFPQAKTPGVTSMLLELSPSYDETRLVTELKRLDPRMLIFLQKLREINIQINTTGEAPWHTSLDKVEPNSSTVLVGQTHDPKTFSYTISKHKAQDMPSDPKREGVRKSEILIAFPTSTDIEDELESQQVYAFLPIRDYGFKFLLQGDFVLSASREDILTDSPWNVALRDCFVEAFVSLVKNSHENFLHHSWPLFLPDDSHASSFFKPARRAILKRLSHDPVVENFLGEPTIARKLLQVPAEFRAENGHPLLTFKSTSSLFLSDQYKEPCLEPLEKVGVRKMGLKHFIETLQKLLKTDYSEFRGASNEWHTEFARILLSALWKHDTDKSQWKVLRKLPIVPLDNNCWVTPAEAGLFLPPDVKDEVRLEGVAIKLVSKEAASDESRAALYRYLDIPTVDKLAMCRYIAASLCRENPSLSISVDISVSQTLFLFKTGWRNPHGQDMWFRNQAAALSRGSELYIPSSSKYSASSYFHSAQARFVHEDYFTAAQAGSVDTDEFKTWLQDCLHIWEIPRLLTVDSTVGFTAGSMRIAQEFRGLVERNDGPPWIYLLRDNYQKYLACFDLVQLSNHKLYGVKIKQAIKNAEQEHGKFIKSIGHLRVRCIGNNLEELSKTYLPQKSIIDDSNGHVPLVDISDPENVDWQYLKKFGLGVEPDLKLYLRCLAGLSLLERTCRESELKSLAVEIEPKVARCLDQIQARYTENVDMVKDHFRQNPLIRVSPVNTSSHHRWLRSNNCLWAGDKCFRILPVLKEQYPGHQTLFNKVLGCGEAQLADLYTEATHFRLGDDLEHIRDIFCEIERRLRNEETDPKNWFGRFASNCIFPVTSGSGPAEFNFNFNKMCKVQAKVEWFIADRDSLYQSFRKRLPLLAFPVSVVRHLKKTMDKMKLDRHRLSRHAQSRAQTRGVTDFDTDLTASMLSRVPYILRLIPTLIPIKAKRRIARHLRALKVFHTDYLIQEWSLKLEDGQIVEGRSCPANVVFVTGKENSLDVFLSRKYFAQSVCKNDVVQHFADFCEIQENAHLLSMALWEGLEEVEQTFQSCGVPDYDPLVDTNDPLDENDDKIPEDDQAEPQPSGVSNNKLQNEGYEIQAYSTMGMVASKNGTQRIVPDAMPRSICLHCAKPSLRFSGVEWQSVFVAPRHMKLPGPHMQITNPAQPRKDKKPKGFLGFIKALGCHSQPADDLMNSGLISAHDIDLQFKGEQFFSTTLLMYLGQNYNPNTHWTSGLRSRAGHKSFIGSSTTHASFTLPDPSGTVTHMMLQEFPDVAQLWATQPPTWHFEVKTTAGTLDSPFHLTNAQIDRARVFSMTNRNLNPPNLIPKNVAVLVRVFNADHTPTPEANIYRDPWEMFLAGDISLKADTVYQCTVGTREQEHSSPNDHVKVEEERVGNSGSKTHHAPPSYFSEERPRDLKT